MRFTRSRPELPHAGETGSDAFELALRRLTPALRGHLFGQLGSGDAIDDVLQETWLRMLRYREIADIDELRALLFRVAANVVADRYRQAESHAAGDHLPIDAIELPATEVQPERVHAAKQNLHLIIAAIRELPPRCRDAFMLHRFENLSYREIAERFGTSPRTVENQIAHALAACRRALGDDAD